MHARVGIWHKTSAYDTKITMKKWKFFKTKLLDILNHNQNHEGINFQLTSKASDFQEIFEIPKIKP